MSVELPAEGEATPTADNVSEVVSVNSLSDAELTRANLNKAVGVSVKGKARTVRRVTPDERPRYVGILGMVFGGAALAAAVAVIVTVAMYLSSAQITSEKLFDFVYHFGGAVLVQAYGFQQGFLGWAYVNWNNVSPLFPIGLTVGILVILQTVASAFLGSKSSWGLLRWVGLFFEVTLLWAFKLTCMLMLIVLGAYLAPATLLVIPAVYGVFMVFRITRRRNLNSLRASQKQKSSDDVKDDVRIA